jgi:hypothetical protein
MTVVTVGKRGNPPYTTLKFHFLAVWSKFDIFCFQIFWSKRGNLLTRGKISSLHKTKGKTKWKDVSI